MAPHVPFGTSSEGDLPSVEMSEIRTWPELYIGGALRGSPHKVALVDAAQHARSAPPCDRSSAAPSRTLRRPLRSTPRGHRSEGSVLSDRAALPRLAIARRGSEATHSERRKSSFFLRSKNSLDDQYGTFHWSLPDHEMMPHPPPPHAVSTISVLR